MKRILAAVVACVCAGVGGPALAQLAPYAGVDLGYGHVEYAPNAVLPNDAGGQGFAPGIFGGIEYGMGPRLTLNGELDWAMTNFKGGQRAGGRVVDHEIHMPINMKVSMGYRFRQTTLSAGVGIGRASIETTDSLTAATVKESANGTSLLLGFRRDLAQRLFVRGEYARTNYGSVNFITGNAAQIAVSAEVFRVGLGRRF